jgi:xanthine dehydrogenase accessory factor
MTAITPPTDLLATIAAWRTAGHSAAIATVVKTWGSAPRPAGSMLAIRNDGHFEGSVSGGCVEGAVITEARAIIAGGLPKLLTFGVSNETAWDVGLACGGEIGVWVEAVTDEQLALFGAVRACHADQLPAVRAIALGGGISRLFAWGDADGALADAAQLAMRADQSRIVTLDGADWFLQVFAPPVHLIIAGAAHIAQSLARMAAELGWRVTVVDPRTGWANPARFPGVALVTEWPDDAMYQLALGPRSAVVTLTHDPKLDDPALTAALRSDAFYIGALGSKKTHEARRSRLTALGFEPESVGRIHGPVGLDIGASGAPEIAVSILAEIVGKLRGARR